MHHEQFDVKVALNELYSLTVKYYDDVSKLIYKWKCVLFTFF